jgi:hypothetical protein
MDMPDSEILKSREEMFARIPSDQRFTWKIAPKPGRLLFVDTVGKSLVALKDIFQSIGGEIWQPQTVGILDAKFDADGAFSVEIVVIPNEALSPSLKEQEP